MTEEKQSGNLTDMEYELREALSDLLEDIVDMFADDQSLQMAAEMARKGNPAITEDVGPKTIQNARAVLAKAEGRNDHS